MNHDEHPNDSALTRELRDSLSELAAPERPPLAAITSRGRAHRRRRLAGFAGLGGAGVAASTALALGLTGVLGAAPARSTGTIRTAAPARSTGTIRTAAFTLTSNANGTDTLTLSHSQMFDPAALQQALVQHGIPSLVKTGTTCASNPAAPDPYSIGVLSNRPRVKPAAPYSPALSRRVAHTVTVINPAAMPSGTELFFGYFNSDHALFFDLIYTSSYTCSNGQPPAATP
jgi:hypothetical protein